MQSIYYCPKCNKVTILPRLRVKYEYEVTFKGKAEEVLYKVPGGYIYKGSKKIQKEIHWDPNNPGTTLTKKSVEKCNGEPHSYKDCNTNIKDCIELHVTDEFFAEVSAFYIGKANGTLPWDIVRNNPFHIAASVKSWLEVALSKDGILPDSLAFVTTLLV